MDKHFEQAPKRHAEFITPPNRLKAKVGFGGLSESILEKAQDLLESQARDFEPLADLYLGQLLDGINGVYNKKFSDDPEDLITHMLFPAMQLKSNGGMFGYPLVTEIGDMLVHFLEVVDEADSECLEIVSAFHKTLHVIVKGKINTDGGTQGGALKDALHDACQRYFRLYPMRVNLVEFD